MLQTFFLGSITDRFGVEGRADRVKFTTSKKSKTETHSSQTQTRMLPVGLIQFKSINCDYK